MVKDGRRDLGLNASNSVTNGDRTASCSAVGRNELARNLLVKSSAYFLFNNGCVTVWLRAKAI
jgi:hypothetical protein